jgi:uncharacterized membrane protein YhfC
MCRIKKILIAPIKRENGLLMFSKWRRRRHFLKNLTYFYFLGLGRVRTTFDKLGKLKIWVFIFAVSRGNLKNHNVKMVEVPK